MAIGNTDLGITLGARVDTSQAQKDIDAFTREDKSGNKRRKVVLDADIKLEKASEQFDKLINKTRQLDDTFKKISTSFALKLKGTFNGEDVEGLTKVTEKFKSDLGEIKERVTIFNEDGKYLTSSLQTIKSGIQEVSNTTTIAIEEVDNVTTKVTTLEKVIEDTDSIQHKIITTTKEWIDEQNRLHQEIKVTDENEKQLSATQKNVINDTKKVTKLMNEFADALARTQEPQTKKTKTSTFIDKDGNKIITEYVDSVATLRTEIKTYTDEVGNLITQTDVYNAKTSQLISTHQELTRNIHQSVEEDKKREQELANVIEKINQERLAQERLKKAITTTTTTHSKGKIQQFGNTIDTREYDALITKTIQVNEANEKVIKTTYEFTNAQGQLVRQTRTTDGYLNKIAEDTVEVSDGFNRTGESAEKANYGVKNLGWNLSDAISRLSNFYIASLPIRAVQTAITETIATVKDFDSALIEFRKVSDLAGESLTNYVDKLAEMGEVTGSTMQAMVEASTEFRKSGFSDEDSAKLASIAEKYRNIADEEISAGESASFIIAQMKAFNIEADQAEHIIDAVNEVANNFSVSSADLATNLGNMSAIMAINNVSMEEQIGMLTGVTEITRNASSASRGLVMISSRLTQVLDESSSTGKKLTAIYDKLGIALKDEDGQLRSHTEILGDLANKWNTLSENEQKYIALTSAGARQQQNFVALMKNWSQVAKATATAYDSMGSAQRENAKVMDSVAKKVEVLKSQFQQLVIGKGGLQDFAKSILDIGIAFLKFANTDTAKMIASLIALEATVIGLSKAWKSFQTLAKSNEIAQAINMLIKGELTLSQTTKALTREFIKNAAAWLTTPMGQATVVIAAMAAVGLAVDAYEKRLERATKKTQELAQKTEETKNELDDLKDQLKDVKDKLKEVNEAKLKITDPDQTKELENQTKELENQELVLKNQLALVEARYALEKKDEAEQAKKALETTKRSAYKMDENFDPTNYGSGAMPDYAQVKATEELELATEALKKNTEERNRNIRLAELEARQHGTDTEVYQTYQRNIANTNAEIEKAQKIGQENADTLNTLRSSLNAVGDEYSDDVAKIDASTEAFLNANNATTETKENIYGIKDAINEKNEAIDENVDELSEEEIAIQALAEAHNVAAEDLKAWAKELGISEEALVNYADALGVSVEKAYEFKTQLESWDEQIDLLQSSFDALSSAVEEYNSNQELSLDTVQALLQLDPQYLTCLEEENGQLSLNKDRIIDKVNALIEERKQIAINIAHERLRKVEIGESANAEVDHQSKVESNTDAIREETNALLANTRAYAAKIVAESNGSKKVAVDQIVSELNKELSMLNKIGDSYSSISSKSSKAGKSAKSAGKAATDAAKEAKKELEDLIKKYEQVIKYINKRYDREIKKIKDAKSEAVKAEEKKIKAVEKEKDHALDAIEKEIKALKKEQDARKKYWSDRIDALKKQNDALKDNLELQEKLDALEKAKNTRVKIYKEGQGFVYDVDQTAVAKAQKELDEYLSQKAYEDELERLEALKDAELDNYEKRLDALNEYKDSVQENYEKQIEQMNEYKDQLSEQYDAQIDKWEEYKEQFGDLVDQYEEQQNKLLFEQLMGIKDENSNWLTRLDNLAEFVRKYNELQMKLNTGDTSVTNTAKMKEGTGGGSGSSNRTSSISPTPTKTSNWVSDKGGSGTSSGNQGYSLNALSAARKRVLGYASGTPSVKSDEIAVVGENPNQEIVIGSKINNGELMNLGKGTGVVNADSSKTLAGMLNQVGQFGASGFGSGNGTLNNNINNDSLVVNGVTIQGANIKDPETFVNGLLNMKAEAIQRAYRHR